MEMPGADHMNLPRVSSALKVGNISNAEIDEAVERILTPMFAVGIMDADDGVYSVLKHSANVSTPEHIATAQNLSGRAFCKHAFWRVLLTCNTAVLDARISMSDWFRANGQQPNRLCF